MLFTGDADDHLIQMSDVMRTRLLAVEALYIVRAELISPVPDRLVQNGETSPEQYFLDKPQAPKNRT
jgi:hypothetical protein